MSQLLGPNRSSDDDSADPQQSSDKRTTGLRSWGIGAQGKTVIGVYVFLLILILASRFVSPSFGSISFTKTVVVLSAFTIIASFGQYIVVVTGGLDLSIPGVMSVGGLLITGLSLGQNSRLWWAVPIVLGVGFLIGAVNGIGVVYLKISPVIMTLAANVILGGVVLVYTDGTPRGSTPPFLVELIQGRLFGGALPKVIVGLVVFMIIGSILMNQTSFGRRVYAVGSNPRVAYLSGVRVNLIMILVYAISGFCAALAGMALAAYSNNSFLGMGDPYLLLSLAAVVVGGTSILGGRGLFVGVVGGAIILTTITTTLAGTSIPDSARDMVIAVVILAAVIVARQEKLD
ncbi:ABC transporter permease [Aeromicrobium sp. A1-2]|uniref:ABC transporter permease n=1 Tax=Aeromicrobium sp. A1-2 TaxID=2107713 RepID=UPI0013C2E388|nr:ABC transporter permease [Aeromicrobium sp. A1-2]